MATNEKRSPKVSVVVSQDEIDNSIQADSSHCMIAESLKVAYPAAKRVSVDLQTIRFTDSTKGLRFTYLTPRVAQLAIVNYDQGIKPEPFQFQLRGGQVTRSGSRQKREGDASAKQVESAKAAGRVQRARLSDSVHIQGGSVPEKIGGKPPPVTPFARRRAFGLRGLK